MIAVPINVRMKTPEVAYILEHSKAAIYFAHPDFLAVAEEARSASGQLKVIHTTLETPDAGDLGALPVVNDDDPALLLYTSGTTTRPKAVTHTHRTLSECVKLTHAVVTDGWESNSLLCNSTLETHRPSALRPMWFAQAFADNV
jgi:acyl-coenzyme A synthetase/AMP-(fatty) acid ligase